MLFQLLSWHVSANELETLTQLTALKALESRVIKGPHLFTTINKITTVLHIFCSGIAEIMRPKLS